MELGLVASHPLAMSTCETRTLRDPRGYPPFFSSVHPAQRLGLSRQGGVPVEKQKHEDMSTLALPRTILAILSSYMSFFHEKPGPLSS